MIQFILIAFIGGSPAHAQTVINPEKVMTEADKVQKPKSSYNTNLYEQEEPKDDSKSFTAKVRVVRDISEDIEVMFEGGDAKGIYSVPRRSKNFAAMVKALEASKKPDGPSVSITADADKNIKSVELNKESHKGFVPPSDPNQKWDFGKVPD